MTPQNDQDLLDLAERAIEYEALKSRRAMAGIWGRLWLTLRLWRLSRQQGQFPDDPYAVLYGEDTVKRWESESEEREKRWAETGYRLVQKDGRTYRLPLQEDVPHDVQ